MSASPTVLPISVAAGTRNLKLFWEKLLFKTVGLNVRSFRERRDEITFNDQEKRKDAAKETEEWLEIWWGGTRRM